MVLDNTSVSVELGERSFQEAGSRSDPSSRRRTRMPQKPERGSSPVQTVGGANVTETARKDRPESARHVCTAEGSYKGW